MCCCVCAPVLRSVCVHLRHPDCSFLRVCSAHVARGGSGGDVLRSLQHLLLCEEYVYNAGGGDTIWT